MVYSITVRGLDEVMAVLAEKAPTKIKQHVGRGLLELAARLTESIQAVIATPFPPPSEPGEPPHLRTGALRRSVRITSASEEETVVSVGGEGTGVPYAAALEWGTSRMEPRPFVAQRVMLISAEAADIVREAIEKNLADAVR